MRPYVVIRYIGLILLFVAGLLFLSVFVSLADGADRALSPLLVSAIVATGLGLFPLLFVREVSQITRREGYAIVAGSWFTVCLIGMLPYLLYGYQFSFLDALFESVSGFTTTGATIIDDLESLPRGLLFWRMSTAWIGGIGIVLFALVILPSARGIGTTLSNMEMSTLAHPHFQSIKRQSIKRQSLIRMLLLTYALLTGASALALRIAGLSWFDAVTHAMSACSSCGFSTRNANIGAFDSVAAESILIVSMILAGTHFGVIIQALNRWRNKRFGLISEVTRLYLLFLLVATLAVTLNLWSSGAYPDVEASLRRGVFHVVSLTTTTGFTITDTNPWPPFSIVVLILCSLVCGCSGSTSGGFKMDRLLIASKSIGRRIALQRHIHRVQYVRVDGKRIEDKKVANVLNFICIYFLVVAAGTLLLTSFGADLQTGFSAAVACLGNVGPGFGAVGSMENFAGMNIPFKTVSLTLMLMGRLEIFGVLQIFYNSVHR